MRPDKTMKIAKTEKEPLSRLIYNSMLKTGSLTAFTLVGAGFVDSLIISRLLGINAAAAAGLAYPFFYLSGIIHGCIGTGFKSMASQRLVRSDVDGFNRIYSIGVELSLAVSAIVTALLLAPAGPMAWLFGARGDSAELYDMTKQYLLGLSVGLPALVLNVLLTSALHFDNGATRVMIAHVVNMAMNILLLFAFSFASIIVCVAAMGKLLGLYGVMAAFTVSDVLVMAMVYGVFAMRKRNPRVEIDDYLIVSDAWNTSPGDLIELDIRSIEDCVLTAEQVELFCRGHKADPKQSKYAGICTEEAAVMLFNITQQAKKKRGQDDSIKLHACCQDGKVRLHFRYYCKGVSLPAEIERYTQETDTGEGPTHRDMLRSFSGEIKLYRSLDIDNLLLIV